MLLVQYGMYHIIVDVTDADVNVGDIAQLEVNPLYVSSNVRREYI